MFTVAAVYDTDKTAAHRVEILRSTSLVVRRAYRNRLTCPCHEAGMDSSRHFSMRLHIFKDESTANFAYGASLAEDRRVADFPPPTTCPFVYQTSFNPS